MRSRATGREPDEAAAADTGGTWTRAGPPPPEAAGGMATRVGRGRTTGGVECGLGPNASRRASVSEASLAEEAGEARPEGEAGAARGAGGGGPGGGRGADIERKDCAAHASDTRSK